VLGAPDVGTDSEVRDLPLSVTRSHVDDNANIGDDPCVIENHVALAGLGDRYASIGCTRPANAAMAAALRASPSGRFIDR
jgi:hypothetical protein